jgi:hypothetical protein
MRVAGKPRRKTDYGTPGKFLCKRLASNGGTTATIYFGEGKRGRSKSQGSPNRSKVVLVNVGTARFKVTAPNESGFEIIPGQSQFVFRRSLFRIPTRRERRLVQLASSKIKGDLS